MDPGSDAILPLGSRSEPVFLNVYEGQESIPRNEFHQPLQPEQEFLKSLQRLETGKKQGYCTNPPGYIGWRNSFFGIDSWAPKTFKNTRSDLEFLKSLWGLGTEQEQGYRTGPPGWRTSILGIDSWAMSKFSLILNLGSNPEVL